jgi:hypothetical protein
VLGRSWLYSSNMAQYLVRLGDDRGHLVDVCERFSLSPIWVLGRTYAFQPVGTWAGALLSGAARCGP